MMFGIGKVKSLNVVEKMPLKHIGERDADLKDVIEEGKKFAAKCFGQVNVSSSRNRRNVWMSKTDGLRKVLNHRP